MTFAARAQDQRSCSVSCARVHVTITFKTANLLSTYTQFPVYPFPLLHILSKYMCKLHLLRSLSYSSKSGAMWCLSPDHSTSLSCPACSDTCTCDNSLTPLIIIYPSLSIGLHKCSVRDTLKRLNVSQRDKLFKAGGYTEPVYLIPDSRMYMYNIMCNRMQ